MNRRTRLLSFLIIFVSTCSILFAQNSVIGTSNVSASRGTLILGVGDEIEIYYYENIAFTDSARIVYQTIDVDGYIFFPMVGNILAEGKSINDLERIIQNSLLRFVENPIIHVTVERKRGLGVSILGSVIHQGTFPIFGSTRIIDFLSDNGGLHTSADVSRIFVIRETGEAIRIDLRQYFDFGDQSQNIEVFSGDQILVPEKELSWIEKATPYLQFVTSVLQVIVLAVVVTK
jgi:polysaccharide biosynthesis/export protein